MYQNLVINARILQKHKTLIKYNAEWIKLTGKPHQKSCKKFPVKSYSFCGLLEKKKKKNLTMAFI